MMITIDYIQFELHLTLKGTMLYGFINDCLHHSSLINNLFNMRAHLSLSRHHCVRH